MANRSTGTGAAAALVGENLLSLHASCKACMFKAQCLPAELDGEALSKFEQAISHELRPVRVGQILVRQDDSMHALYALRVGALKAIVRCPDGNERVVGFRFPGTVIGLAEPALERWARTFVALEDSRLCRIPVEALDDALRRQLIRLMSERLRREYDCHLTLAFRSRAGKLATLLLELSESQRRRGLAPHRFTLPMNYADIASYLGMRHESVCRTFALLQSQGFIEREGRRVFVRHLEALRDIP